MTQKTNRPAKPGFTRVWIPERNRSIQVRTSHVHKKGWLEKYGMTLMPEPQTPPAEVVQSIPKVTPVKSKVTKRMPGTPVIDADQEGGDQ